MYFSKIILIAKIKIKKITERNFFIFPQLFCF